MSVKFGGVTLLKAAQLLGKHAIKSIGYHGHDHIEVNLYKDWRRKGINVKEFNGLGDPIFNPPSSGVISHKEFYWSLKIVGDEERWFFVTITPKDDLIYF